MTDRRTDDRRPTFKTGTILHAGARQSVTILNLSGGGAMVDASEAVPEGAELVFECPATGETPARVTWVIGKRCGLAFTHIVEVIGEDDIAA